MINEHTIQLLTVFALSSLSSFIGFTKMILIIKSDGYSKYLMTIIDTFIFGFVLKELTKDMTVYVIIAFTLGKLLGLFLSDIITNRFSQTKYEINLFIKNEIENSLNAFMIEKNISFTKFKGHYDDKKQIMFMIQASDKQKKEIFKHLSSLGVKNPTMTINETKVYGKIKAKT